MEANGTRQRKHQKKLTGQWWRAHEKVWADLAGIVLLSGPIKGFSSRRGDMLPDKREIWHRRADQRSATRAKFPVYRGRNVGIQPPKLSKFWILAIDLPLRGYSYAQFLQNSQILYASPGGF